MQDLSEIIGSNPRAIKRFVNVYHIVRAHADLRIDSENSRKDYLVIMFLLALPIGPYKRVFGHFRKFILNITGQEKTLMDFLNSLEPDNDLQNVDIQDFKIWFLESNDETVDILSNVSAQEFSNRNQFIQRFTFKSML
jgi:hypothetical protein